MAGTSPIGSAQQVAGLLLQVGNSSSPENFQTIANATDVALPLKADVVDVTNVSDAWHRRFPTLLDMGAITFKIFWIMEEVTHRNAPNGGLVGAGLRYLFVNRLKRDYQFVYPDGNSSTDAFAAYVTDFSIAGKTGGVFEANVTLSNDNAPSLV